MLAAKKSSEEMDDIPDDLAEGNVGMKMQISNRINRFQNGKIVTKTFK